MVYDKWSIHHLPISLKFYEIFMIALAINYRFATNFFLQNSSLVMMIFTGKFFSGLHDRKKKITWTRDVITI